MIVGSYVLHLYCAAECAAESSRSVQRGIGSTDGQFDGNNERHARAKARRRGWIFRNGEAWCSSWCARLGPPKEKK